MRLDKFLKISRLIKRRTSAAEAGANGRISVNGNVAKPSKQLKIGDIIEIEYRAKTLRVKVLKVPDGNVSVNEASSLYEELY